MSQKLHWTFYRHHYIWGTLTTTSQGGWIFATPIYRWGKWGTVGFRAILTPTPRHLTPGIGGQKHQGDPPGVKVLCEALTPQSLHHRSLLLHVNRSRLSPICDLVSIPPTHVTAPPQSFSRLWKSMSLQNVACVHILQDISCIGPSYMPEHTSVHMHLEGPTEVHVPTRDTHRLIICPL